MVEASGLASAPEPIPPALARHLVDLMAQQRMLPETLHMLELCRSDDAMVVTGSDFDLRLQILSIDDALDIAVKEHDKEDPPKYFERLLKRFDLLVSFNLYFLAGQLSQFSYDTTAVLSGPVYDMSTYSVVSHFIYHFQFCILCTRIIAAVNPSYLL